MAPLMFFETQYNEGSAENVWLGGGKIFLVTFQHQVKPFQPSQCQFKI